MLPLDAADIGNPDGPISALKACRKELDGIRN
jgi:hypothetical protein